MSCESLSDRLKEEHEFVGNVFKMILQNTEHENVLRKKVIDFKSPEELKKIFDFSLPTNGQAKEELLSICQLTFDYSANMNHPRFLNQIYAKPDPYGVAADAIATSISTNIHTFEVAPVFVLAEKALIERSLHLFGFSQGEGAFCPGGSYGIMLGMNLAKFAQFPNAKEDGLFNLPRFAIFGSKQCHYSIRKNSALLGYGLNSVIDVECDDNGKMIPEDLEKKIVEAGSKGMMPLYVQATAGTTVLGAFDPLDKIADVCAKHGVWMHVDAAYGGSVMFSQAHKHICKGIERVDSLSWNPHKLMAAPIQCSIFLTKHIGMMESFHSIHVPYLFQPDKAYDTSYDIGTNLVQCGRRIDSFKFWLMWKARGDKGFEQMIDKAFDNTKYFISELKKRKNFEMVVENLDFTNVPFWYIPPSLLGKAKDPSYWSLMATIPPHIKGKMQHKGSLMVGYQPLGDKVNFFRLAVVNKDVTYDDMDYVLNEIEHLGADL